MKKLSMVIAVLVVGCHISLVAATEMIGVTAQPNMSDKGNQQFTLVACASSGDSSISPKRTLRTLSSSKRDGSEHGTRRTYTYYGTISSNSGNSNTTKIFIENTPDIIIDSVRITVNLVWSDIDSPSFVPRPDTPAVMFNGVNIGCLTTLNTKLQNDEFVVDSSLVKFDSYNTLWFGIWMSESAVNDPTWASVTIEGHTYSIKNVTSSFCSGKYGNVHGRKATFLTGVGCDVDFDVEIDKVEGIVIDHLRVNGERYSNIDTWFSYDVGSLSPSDKIEVVAVDVDGNESEPFRVNLDIADYPPLWMDITRILAEPQPEQRRVLYTAAVVSELAIFDAIEDGLDIAGEESPIEFLPSIKLYQTFESDTAKFRTSSDIDGSNKNQTQRIGRFSELSFDASFSGGRVYQWVPSAQTWLAVGRDLGVKIAGQAETPKFRIPAFPIAYAKVGLLASGDFIAQEQDGMWYCDINCDPLVALRGTVGVGVDGILCGEGYLQGGVILHAVTPGTPNHIQQLGLQAKAELRGIVCGFEHSLWSWDATHWLIGGRRAMRMAASPLIPLGVDDSEWSLISRGYSRPSMRSGSRVRRLGATSDASASIGDGYPYPSPTLAANGACDVLIYLRDNQSRTAINRTEMVYRSGMSNEWASAETVWDDGTADFMPNVLQGRRNRVRGMGKCESRSWRRCFAGRRVQEHGDRRCRKGCGDGDLELQKPDGRFGAGYDAKSKGRT